MSQLVFYSHNIAVVEIVFPTIHYAIKLTQLTFFLVKLQKKKEKKNSSKLCILLKINPYSFNNNIIINF